MTTIGILARPDLSSGEDITERARAEGQARTRLGHLAALHEIDLAISSSLDLRVTLARLVDQVREQFRVDAADGLLLDPHTQTLEYAAGRGFRGTGIERSRLRLGEGIAGVAALERRSLHLPDLLDPAGGFVRGPLLEGEGFVSLYDVPLVAKGNVQGVLETLHRSPLRLDEEQLGFLEPRAAESSAAVRALTGEVRQGPVVSNDILNCPSCGAANRIVAEKVSANIEAVCGQCNAPLGVTSEPVEVSDEEFQAKVAQSPLPVLVDFWAPWCGPCRMVAPSLEALAKEMAGRVRIAKVNVDDNPVMAGQLGVRGIPTMVLFKNGQEVDRQVGALPKRDIQRWIESVA